MGLAKTGMAATYVQITREELEGWLKTLRFPWKRETGKAGIYLILLSRNVAIKLSSTIGTRDDAMGKGKASMNLALVSLITGVPLNRKSTTRGQMGQTRFHRTTNWRKTWAAGIAKMEKAYKKMEGFYEAVAVVKDRRKYQKENLALIESIPNWRSDRMLSDFHSTLEKGWILTVNQKAALEKAARQAPGQSSRDTGRAVWNASGGASGEEGITFKVIGPDKVLFYHNHATADIPWDDVRGQMIPFERAREIWDSEGLSESFWDLDNKTSPPFMASDEPDEDLEQDDLVQMLRELYVIGRNKGDRYLMDFAKKVGIKVKSQGVSSLSQGQQAFMEKNFAKYRLASGPDPRLVARIARRYLVG